MNQETKNYLKSGGLKPSDYPSWWTIFDARAAFSQEQLDELAKEPQKWLDEQAQEQRNIIDRRARGISDGDAFTASLYKSIADAAAMAAQSKWGYGVYRSTDPALAMPKQVPQTQPARQTPSPGITVSKVSTSSPVTTPLPKSQATTVGNPLFANVGLGNPNSNLFNPLGAYGEWNSPETQKNQPFNPLASKLGSPQTNIPWQPYKR